MDTIINQVVEFDVAGSQATLSIQANPFNLDIHHLFSLAIRNNTKRKLLFVSKVLGKHIPVSPTVSLSCGKLMACLFAKHQYDFEIDPFYHRTLVHCLEDNSGAHNLFHDICDIKIKLPENPIFIGFAETATALGQSVFSSFSNECYYIHTTREPFETLSPLLNFDEEHSHSVLHKLFPQNMEIFMKDTPIVLVDDEITTGKSSLNLIESLHKLHPHSRYTILSILDWRSEEDKASFKECENRLSTQINVVSLISGSIYFQFCERRMDDDFLNPQNGDSADTKISEILLNRVYFEDFVKFGKSSTTLPYLNYTGRFGLSTSEYTLEQQTLASCSQILKNMRHSEKTLCLGTGEFMYLPMLLSSQMGKGIYFHSTTRSPIYSNRYDRDYPIQDAYHFKDFYDNETDFYLYNIPTSQYKEAFIFFERDIDNIQLEKIKLLFSNTTINRIVLVVFSKKGKEINAF